MPEHPVEYLKPDGRVSNMGAEDHVVLNIKVPFWWVVLTEVTLIGYMIVHIGHNSVRRPVDPCRVHESLQFANVLLYRSGKWQPPPRV